MSKRWFTEIGDLRDKYFLLMVVRDNSRENTSKELNGFFTEKGVNNWFSTPYEKLKNGLAEPTVGSVTILKLDKIQDG
jgi:transposase InsO family protein